MSKTVPLSDVLISIRSRAPLVHNITNFVVMNFAANTLLALGASPVMAHAPEEVEEMVKIADSLVINIGTLDSMWIKSMETAMKAARYKEIPMIFDPVGAGATKFRTQISQRFISEFAPSVVRANYSEILAVSGCKLSKTKGVDANPTQGNQLAPLVEVATALAQKHKMVVCASGESDIVTDGVRCAIIKNGHPWMTQVTGMGCASTAVTAALCAVHSDYWEATVAAMAIMGVCGEEAFRSIELGSQDQSFGLGTFQVRFIDAIQNIKPKLLSEKGRVEVCQ